MVDEFEEFLALKHDITFEDLFGSNGESSKDLNIDSIVSNDSGFVNNDSEESIDEQNDAKNKRKNDEDKEINAQNYFNDRINILDIDISDSDEELVNQKETADKSVVKENQ
jgi:hypothetical protein